MRLIDELYAIKRMFYGSLDQREAVCKMQEMRKLYAFLAILKTQDRKTDIVAY